MIQCLIEIWRVILGLVFRYEVESPRDSETGQTPLPSAITLAKDGEGSGPSSSSSSSFPMLNDHICQLYKPNGKPTMEILFFHGLQLEHSTDFYLSTWRTGDDSQKVWPATWLAEDFPDAHIFAMRYDASMKTTPEQGRSDLFIVAENLKHALCSANIGQGFRRPVILVGHSFGGLVMKQLCVDAHRAHNKEKNLKIRTFLSNVRGLFFYGTPHHGIPDFYKIAGRSLDGPLLDYVKVLNKGVARLESSFSEIGVEIWRIAGVGELHETSWGAFKGLVVPEASARYGTDFSTVGADHFSLCKPATKTSNSFLRLTNFIRQVHVDAPFEDVQRLPEVTVGLDLRVEVVQKMLRESTRVGIFGMGGVGKTTVARAVFNRLGPTFEYTCFCADVKLIEARSVDDLKKRIWEHMHCDGKKVANEQGQWSKLRGKRLLLVLDDVDHERHVEVFSDIVQGVAPESIFLMTSREKDILKFKLDNNELYEVPFVSENDARPLFLSHAFPKQALPPPALEKHVDDLVMKCEGLPLTLEVLGKSLRGEQDVNVWEQALDALGKAESVLRLNERLWEKLRVSYDRLGEEVQHMFLDATTFFSDRSIGYFQSYFEDRYLVRYTWTLLEAKAAWNAVYGYESLRWKTLVDASLVFDVKEDEPIKVHEQLLSLGRKIASEDAKKGVQGRRVWEGTEGWKWLQSTDESDHEEIHSLRLSEPKPYYRFYLPRTFLSRLKNLQYLDVQESIVAIERVSIDGAQENERLRTNLVILRSPNLHYFRIHFDLTLPRLAVLTLTCYDEQSLPDSFAHLSNLKVLSISNALSLKTLPQSFGELSSLEHFYISNAPLLETLPQSFGELSSLKDLSIFDAPLLDTLPQSFGGLSTLKHLLLDNCPLRTLPESFGGLFALNHLLLNYVNLKTLPQSIGGLSALNHVIISNCGNFSSIPESFGGLAALNHLEIENCKEFGSLPESFGGLSALNHVIISNCGNFSSIPESFGGLAALNHLEIENCKEFGSLPKSFGRLEYLSYLEISKCPKFETFPDSFSQLKALRHLTMKLLPIRNIPECIKRLPSLQILELRFLPYLKGLPPWLRQMLSAPPNMCHLQKFSRTQEGHFAQEDLKISDWQLRSDHEWWCLNSDGQGAGIRLHRSSGRLLYNSY